MTTASPNTIGQPSDTLFHVFHLLRAKGYTSNPSIAAITSKIMAEVDAYLQKFEAYEWITYQSKQSFWRLTASEIVAHAELLVQDCSSDIKRKLRIPYQDFLQLNRQFKSLCGDWQLQNGAINDHPDAEYDAAIITRLIDLNATTLPVLVQFSSTLQRFHLYQRRFEKAYQLIIEGDIRMLTGVMCNSYHDIWMELYEDLLLPLNIDREAEGSS